MTKLGQLFASKKRSCILQNSSQNNTQHIHYWSPHHGNQQSTTRTKKTLSRDLSFLFEKEAIQKWSPSTKKDCATMCGCMSTVEVTARAKMNRHPITFSEPSLSKRQGHDQTQAATNTLIHKPPVTSLQLCIDKRNRKNCSAISYKKLLTYTHR